MPTIGEVRWRAPVDPKKGEDPKANTPPSEAASHVPPSVAVGATGPPDTGSAAAARPGRPAAMASRALSQRRKRREPRIVVPDTLRVLLVPEKRARDGSTLSPRFAAERGGHLSRARRGHRSGPQHGRRRRGGRTYVGSRREREREPGRYVRP